MEFKIDKVLPNGLGRIGTIKTAHGEIKTPAFTAVGTKGEVKFISMEELHELNAQAMLSNGYHLRNKAAEIAVAGGLAEYSGWKGPTVTDSGGFQIMSLGDGFGKKVAMTKELGVKVKRDESDKGRAIVTEEGVEFTDPKCLAEDYDGPEIKDFIGPEESMRIQCQIGADIHMAFDELTSFDIDKEKSAESLTRTERWAERSLAEHKKHCDDLGYHQNLYGVLQGGRWEDLRRSTAKKLGAMDFDGYGLGGALEKEKLGEILRWCTEELPFEKPRHLLGLSHPDDIFVGVEMGADTFDCVAPTREARHGKIYTRDGEVNLRKCTGSTEPLDHGCDCATCRAGWTRGDLRALWRSGNVEKKVQFWNLASVHNLRFIVRLTEEIRQSILDDRFEEFKEEFLTRYYGPKKA